MNCLWVMWTAVLDSPKLPKKAKTKGKKKLKLTGHSLNHKVQVRPRGQLAHIQEKGVISSQPGPYPT